VRVVGLPGSVWRDGFNPKYWAPAAHCRRYLPNSDACGAVRKSAAASTTQNAVATLLIALLMSTNCHVPTARAIAWVILSHGKRTPSGGRRRLAAADAITAGSTPSRV